MFIPGGGDGGGGVCSQQCNAADIGADEGGFLGGCADLIGLGAQFKDFGLKWVMFQS